MWWIAGGIVAAALLVLVVVVLRVLGGLRELRYAVRALQQRATEVGALQDGLAVLRHRAEELREPIAAAQERVALIQARRGD
jgi:uncharacterized protein YoxC